MTLEQDFETVQRESRMWGEAHDALDRIRTALVDHQRFLREARAELERQRLDIESFKRIHDSAEAEVEQLRGLLQAGARALEVKDNEVERLRAQNKELLDVRDAAAEELPRVYAEAEKWERFFKLEKEATRSEHVEVERLTAALKVAESWIGVGPGGPDSQTRMRAVRERVRATLAKEKA